jgi:uncharacterized protein involved in exopolysaccharide biosynthesis
MSDELGELWQTLWRGRWLLCMIVGACTALAIAFAFLVPEWYRSEGILIPASPKSPQSLSGQLANLGGLAGLAGMSLLGSGSTSEPIAVLRSRDLIREFIRENNLLPVLFAPKWGSSTGRWKETNPNKQPDVRDGIRLIQERILAVQEDKKTGLVSISVEWRDPILAAAWANQLIERVNERMRARALTESDSNIAYLRNQLITTSETSLQQAASRLLENELQKAMLARGNKEYAFHIVDRPDVPKRRSFPNRSLTVALGFLSGGIIGVCVVIFRRSLVASSAVPKPRESP